METPSSNRRVTRSQSAASNNKNLPISRKLEDSDMRQRSNGKQQQQEKSALIDITNDSPIVGVAAGNSLRTPSSSILNKRSNRAKSTPGSGEALLRGQVKILLQKVEEEAVLSKVSTQNRPLVRLQGLVNSPMGLLAPTPANTPQVLTVSDDGSMNSGLVSSTALVNIEEQLIPQQVVVGDIFDEDGQESLESQKSIITRSLLLDFSEKSELSDSSECSSVLTCLGGGPEGESGSKEKSLTTDDDNASVWSIQVNASAHGEDEDEDEDDEDAAFIEEGEVGEEEEEQDDEYEEEDGSLVDELCQGVSKMWVNSEKKMPEFAGSHTRFVYNSDDEIVEEEEEGSGRKGNVSPSVVRLKGLPTPRGKHMRFAEDGNAE